MERDLNPNSEEATLFVNVTSSTDEDAIFFLQRNNNNVDDAVADFYAFKCDTVSPSHSLTDDLPLTAQGDTVLPVQSFSTAKNFTFPSTSTSDEAGGRSG
jgi:hypothetical protein